MVSNDLVAKELDKLTKSKLIEIIITKKVPSDIKLSENVRKVVEIGENLKFFEFSSDIGDQNSDLTNKYQATVGLKCFQIELECIKKLNTELERSIQNQQITISAQELLISTLKNNNNFKPSKCNVATVNNLSQAPESSKKRENYSQNNVTKNTVSFTKKEEVRSQRVSPQDVEKGIKEAQRSVLSEYVQPPVSRNSDEWKNVSYKKRKPNVLIGSKNASEMNIRAVPKTVDLHVYRLHPDTTATQITHLLKPLFPEVKTEKLESKNSELYASFKVTIHQVNFSKAMDASVWPVNTCVRRFLYHRNKYPETT